MISISHAQAKRLINAQLDERKLPDEQWSTLHAHLESCADCCAFRDRLALAERRLRRGLRQRWEPVDGPLEATAKPLAVIYHERCEIRRLGRRMLGGAGAFLLLALMIVGLSAWFPNRAETAAVAAVDTQIPPTPLPSPTPTHIPSDYKGVIAYEYRQPADDSPGVGAGSVTATLAPGEIYLLNTGAEPSNLTSSPADDHDPAWSPDGEWLAFLSDLATGAQGKDEVYIMHLSGSRLTQLTDLPGVTWRGPISWSADGQTLALIGERAIGEQPSTWVYLVPLDGSNAYPLGHSKGAMLAAFSSKLPLLAFSGADAWNGSLAVYNFDPQHEGFSSPGYGSEIRYDGTTVTETVDRFEWSLDGNRLLFRSNRAYQTSASKDTVKTVGLGSATFIERTFSFNTTNLALKPASPDPFTAFSWTRIKNEFAYLDGPLEDGCKTIRLALTNGRKVQQPETHGFCIDGSLLQENWRVTDKSVLVTGWEPERPGERGLYVVRFRSELAYAEWLADARGITGPALLRPEGDRLAIDPRSAVAAAAAEGTPAPTAEAKLPGPETGDLLMISKMNERTLIERVDPASGKHTLINQSVGGNHCPVWSPDRTRIAFVSDRRGMSLYGTELFFMDSSGLHARPVADVPYYSCPLWSPDGRWLAIRGGYGVSIIPVDEKGGDAQFVYPYSGDYADPLAWLPDGRLLLSEFDGNELILRAYEPGPNQAQMHSADHVLLQTKEWNGIAGVTIAPDGKTVFFIGVHSDPQGISTFTLLTASLESSTPGVKADTLIIQSNLPPLIGGAFYRTLGWLPDGRVAYLVHYPDGRREKAVLYAWAGADNQPELLAAFTDSLLNADLSPDNRWLTALTETGRYVLDLTAPQPEPIWVGPETGGDLDW